MDEAEFDKFAEEYHKAHQRNIRLSGEDPEFFARYKVLDLKKLAARYALPRASNILDFGCGVGASLGYIASEFQDSQVVGVDVSQKSLEVAQQNSGRTVSLVKFDGAVLPFADATFNIAFAACVFHHIPHEHHLPLLRELRRVLAPRGAIVLFEHNPLNPLTLHAVNTCEFDENAVLIRGGVLKGALKAAGFSGPELTYRIFFPGFLAKLRPVEHALGWLPLGAQYYVAATA
jgi:SAM-dependent methyltransferase